MKKIFLFAFTAALLIATSGHLNAQVETIGADSVLTFSKDTFLNATIQKPINRQSHWTLHNLISRWIRRVDAAAVKIATKGQINGVAPLNAQGQIPAVHIPTHGHAQSDVINLTTDLTSLENRAKADASAKAISAISTANSYTVSELAALANVARTGSYTDLSNKPSIPSISGLATTTDLTTGLATKANASDVTTLQTNFTTLSNNTVRLLDVGTFYVSPSSTPSLATMGDEFKPYPSPWAARDAAARKIKDGEISAATIIVKRGTYSFGLTATGATYTIPYAPANSNGSTNFAIDTIPYYTASPKSPSLLDRNLSYKFQDGATVTFLGTRYDLLTTSKPDTCSIIVEGAGEWFKVLSITQGNSGNTNFCSIANDSSKISIVAPNSDWINSTGWQGAGIGNRYTNFDVGRVIFNKCNGIQTVGSRLTALTKPRFFRLNAKLWTDRGANYVNGFVNAADVNYAAGQYIWQASGLDSKVSVDKVEICLPMLGLRGNSTQYGPTTGIDTSVIQWTVKDLYLYRQTEANINTIANIFSFNDTVRGTDVQLRINKATTEGGFLSGTAFNGGALLNSRVLLDCQECRATKNTTASTTAYYAIDYTAQGCDSLSVITIKGNYTIDSCYAKGIRIAGTAPIQIVLEGTFNMRNSTIPLLEINNPNARIILKSGSRLISSGATTITGVSGAKIYAQAGSEISGATTTATVITTRPSTWNF